MLFKTSVVQSGRYSGLIPLLFSETLPGPFYNVFYNLISFHSEM